VSDFSLLPWRHRTRCQLSGNKREEARHASFCRANVKTGLLGLARTQRWQAGN
jgi:hypothetical protein